MGLFGVPTLQLDWSAQRIADIPVGIAGRAQSSPEAACKLEPWPRLSNPGIILQHIT